MKKVAIFPSAFAPSLGGVEELSRQQALELQRQGGSVVICTDRWPRTLAEREIFEGVPVWRYPFRMPWGGWRARMSFAYSSRSVLTALCHDLKRWGAELIHVQCISANAWYAREAAKWLGIPWVLSSQGERTMDASGLYQRSPLFNRVLRMALDEAHFVSACSKATFEDLESYSGIALRDRGSVIYNGVGLEAFAEGASWPHSRPYVLALGRMVPQKGFHHLLEAFGRADVKECDLLLAGEGCELERLKLQSARLRLEGRVHFVGRAERRVVRELIRGCRAVAVPSVREPMGIVALEAMAQGKPLVASRVDGLAEVAEMGTDCFLVEPQSELGLTAALQWAVSSAPLFSPGNRNAARLFEWKRIVSRYQSAYGQAAELFRERQAAPQSMSVSLVDSSLVERDILPSDEHGAFEGFGEAASGKMG